MAWSPELVQVVAACLACSGRMAILERNSLDRRRRAEVCVAHHSQLAESTSQFDVPRIGSSVLVENVKVFLLPMPLSGPRVHSHPLGMRHFVLRSGTFYESSVKHMR
jgi:hypothetical protein